VKDLARNCFLFICLILAPSIGWTALNVFPDIALGKNNNTSSNSNSTNNGPPQTDIDGVVAETKTKCAADPKSCGITLSSFLDNTGFGETEPNNYALSADPLDFDVKYWGQLSSPEDQDWFYVTTTASNQILTVDFTIPGLSNISGWNISVRDSGGNIFSEINSGFDGASETLLQTVLSHAGSYYVVVRPLNQDGQITYLSYDYNLAAFLSSSQITAEPVDVNFFDAEVEPNDNRAQANPLSFASPLSSNVTMMGLLSGTLIPGSVGFDFEEDWFAYQTTGNEILSVEFCARQDCEGSNWQVTVFDESGLTLVNMRTDMEKRFDLGIRNPGRYLLRLSVAPKLDEEKGGVTYVCSIDPTMKLKDCPNPSERTLIVESPWHQYNFTVTSTKLPPLMSEVNNQEAP
jgi:hypothetical protein